MRIRIYIIIDFLSIYLLYNVNSQLFDNVAELIFDLYNKRINSAFFFQ